MAFKNMAVGKNFVPNDKNVGSKAQLLGVWKVDEHHKRSRFRWTKRTGSAGFGLTVCGSP